MAQADGVVANGTGSAVRSDINTQYAALWSNHSGSTEPSSGKVAYQFWADTNTSILKIRNSANNAWINLFTLAGGVDVDAASNFNEDVTFTGASANAVWDKSDNALEFADNAKCTFGTGNLQLYYDGARSWVRDNGSGNLIIDTNGSEIDINSGGNAEYMARFIKDGAVELYYGGSRKFYTISSGTITSGHSYFLDNNKVILGSSDDFQLWHDGSNSYLTNTTGALHIRNNGIYFKNAAGSENFIDCSTNAEVSLFYDNSKRIETTNNGAKVTAGNNSYGLWVDCNDTSYASIVLNVECDRNTTDETYSHIGCHRSGVASVFFVRDSGNVENANNSYGSTSDERLKENIVDASSQWDDIKNLKVRKFNFKETTDPDKKTMIGLVAQEAEKVSPGLVSESKSMQGGVEGTYKTVKYSILYMKAIKALQEAMAKIETLETKVAALEAK